MGLGSLLPHPKDGTQVLRLGRQAPLSTEPFLQPTKAASPKPVVTGILLLQAA